MSNPTNEQVFTSLVTTLKKTHRVKISDIHRRTGIHMNKLYVSMRKDGSSFAATTKEVNKLRALLAEVTGPIIEEETDDELEALKAELARLEAQRDKEKKELFDELNRRMQVMKDEILRAVGLGGGKENKIQKE